MFCEINCAKLVSAIWVTRQKIVVVYFDQQMGAVHLFNLVKMNQNCNKIPEFQWISLKFCEKRKKVGTNVCFRDWELTPRQWLMVFGSKNLTKFKNSRLFVQFVRAKITVMIALCSIQFQLFYYFKVHKDTVKKYLSSTSNFAWQLNVLGLMLGM